MNIPRFLLFRTLMIQSAAVPVLCASLVWAPLAASAEPAAASNPVAAGEQAAENLLQNASFENGEGKVVAGWGFSVWNFKAIPGLEEQIEWGVTEVDGRRALSFVSKPGIKANLWWQQRQEVTGTGEYQLSVTVKAEQRAEGARGAIDVGVYFLDSNGKWLEYKQLPTSRKLTGEWTTVTGKIVAPERATKLTVRLGLDFEGAVAVFFSNPELRPAL